MGAKSECLNLQNIVIVLLFEVDNAQLKTMSVATRVGTNIRDECYMDGGGVGNTDNNKTSQAGASPNKNENGKNWGSDHTDNRGPINVQDDIDKSSFYEGENNMIEAPKKSNYESDSSDPYKPHSYGRKTYGKRIADEVEYSEYEDDGPGERSRGKHLSGSDEFDNPKADLSVTGIVQRNLGSPSDPSTKIKESIYNFDDDEDQVLPPSGTGTSLSSGKVSKLTLTKTFSTPSAATSSLHNKTKVKLNPAMIFVAKKSQPTTVTNEIKGLNAKKIKKKHPKKSLKKEEPIKPPPVVEKIDKRILSLDTNKDLYKEGYLVWGKIRGFSYWPGIITVDPMDGLTVKFMKESSDIPYSHVHFLGYERSQRAWLPETNIMEFKGIEHFVDMAAKNPSKKKDFAPKKSLLERFEKGMDIAESVLALPFRQRLEKLDLVYVLIPAVKEKEEKEERKPLVRKQPPEDKKESESNKRKRKRNDSNPEKSSPEKTKRKKK